MKPSFTIIVNEARPDSWPDIVWRDARNAGAHVLLDSCTSLPSILRNLPETLLTPVEEATNRVIMEQETASIYEVVSASGLFAPV